MFLDVHVNSHLYLTKVFVSEGTGINQVLTLSTGCHNLVDTAPP